MSIGPGGQIDIDLGGDGGGDGGGGGGQDPGDVTVEPDDIDVGGTDDAAGADPGDVTIDPGDIDVDAPTDDQPTGQDPGDVTVDPGDIDTGTDTGGDAGRDTQLEQETGVDTGDVAAGEASQDLTEQPEQTLGPSGGPGSGFRDPDRIRQDQLRFAQERQQIGDRTIQRGEALPTRRDLAQQVERQAVEEADGLGPEDIAVGFGLQPSLTEEGQAQVQRDLAFERQQQTEAVQERRETLALAPQDRQATATEEELQATIEAGQQQRQQQAEARQALTFGQVTDVTPGERQASTLGEGLGNIGQAIAGPPGTLESEAGFAVQNPFEAIVGPPGSVESAAGTVAFGARDVSRGAADFVTEEVVRPAGPVIGEAAESTPLTAAADVVPQGLSVTVEELTGAEEQQRGFDLSGTGPETPAGMASEAFATGAGIGAVETTIGLPAGAVEAGALGADAAEFTARQVEQEGLVEGGAAAAGAGVAFARTAAGDIYQSATESPAQFGGMLAGGFVTGVGAGRAIESAAVRGRVAATTRGETIDFEDLTTGQAAETGELPEFETPPSAPTRQAVSEVRTRAADQPEGLQQELGESILFRSETERLPSDVEAQRGQFELPGLFASPDASPLRLDIGAESASRFVPRLPRPTATPQRLSAFESPDIEGMPESATGARIITGPEGQRMPDPETGGAQFLDVEAERGTAFVRPTGSRTTELEAIFPPGSEFQRVGARAVDVEGGDPGTLDLFRRVDTEEADVDDIDTITGEEIIRRSRRSGAQSGTPVVPPATSSPFGGRTADTQTTTEATPTNGTETPTVTEPTVTGSGSAPSSPFGGTAPTPTGVSEPTQATETTQPTEPSPTGPTETTPSSPFTSTPTEATPPPSQPPTSPPSEPSRGPPTSPPTSPPSQPSRGPPTSVQSGPPTSPFGGVPGQPSAPTQRPRTPESDADDDEEEVAQIGPAGTPFQNPVATGGQLLFGDLPTGFGGIESAVEGGDSDENPDPTGLFLG